jgi:hypothetical protein
MRGRLSHARSVLGRNLVAPPAIFSIMRECETVLAKHRHASYLPHEGQVKQEQRIWFSQAVFVEISYGREIRGEMRAGGRRGIEVLQHIENRYFTNKVCCLFDPDRSAIYGTALGKGSGGESKKARGSEVKIRNAARKGY